MLSSWFRLFFFRLVVLGNADYFLDLMEEDRALRKNPSLIGRRAGMLTSWAGIPGTVEAHVRNELQVAPGETGFQGHRRRWQACGRNFRLPQTVAIRVRLLVPN